MSCHTASRCVRFAKTVLKNTPIVGPRLRKVYLRFAKSDGAIQTISGGYLQGWKLHRFIRTIQPRHLSGEYEFFIQKIIIESLHPGDLFFDVGANAGFLSLVAAKTLNASGRVVAFEAHPATAAEASKQFKLNHLSNATVVAAAVMNEKGFVELDEGWSSDMVKLAQLEEEIPKHHRIVPAVTLDDQIAIHGIPDVIKMDIEGAEMLALRGAKKMLASGRCTLLIEVHSQQLSQQIYHYLECFGYRFYQLTGKEVTDRSYVRFLVARKSMSLLPKQPAPRAA